MSFVAFEEAIKSPALKQVARHWNAMRGDRAMPGWSDIQPTQIAKQLSIIWSYRYDRETDAFIGRLAGDQIEHIFGKTLRGTPMTELYPVKEYPKMSARFRRVVTEPVLYLEDGKVFQLVDRYGYGERIVMPLSSNGVLGDGIFGATAYETFLDTHAIPHPDSEQWFAL